PTTAPRPTPPPRRAAAVRAAPVTTRPATAPRSAPPPRPRPTTTTTAPPPPPPPAHQVSGEASWYDGPDGQCAFNDAPLGPVVTVTNLANGRSTTCQVASRGPFNGRVIDLTRSTFARIASTSQGVIDVRVT